MKSKPVINGNSVLQERENEEINYLSDRDVLESWKIYLCML
jgi:hypothetical protein